MSDIVIKVENLSKQYRIGTREGYKTFRETLVDAAKAPFQRLRSALTNITNRTNQTNSTNGTNKTTQTNMIWALRDVSFEVKQGEVVGIIGRNGAGKSTLLKILSQITEPTEGRVELKGRVGSLLEVGTGFHPELTGHENIYLYGAILGMDRWEVTRKFDDIVSFAEIEKFIDTPVKRYSSGMYVRLAFAVAAHLEPEILFVDEVLAVGDATFQKKCLGKMGEVSNKGRTVLFVSHNMAAIQQLCNRALVIEKGSLVKSAGVREAVAYYLTKAYKQESTGTDNIFYRPRKEGFGTLVRVSKCKLFDSSDIENYCLKFSEPFIIEIECLALSDVNNISFVIGIDSVYGARIATSMSEECNYSMSIRKEQTLRMRLSIENLNLKPGHYSITAGIRGIKGGMDQVENARSFQITSLIYDESQVPTEKWGIVHISPNWSICKVDYNTSAL